MATLSARPAGAFRGDGNPQQDVLARVVTITKKPVPGGRCDMEYKFNTIVKSEGKNAAGIVVPPEIVEALGSGRNPKVKVSVNGYTFRGTVQVSNGRFMLSFSSDKRE